MRGQKRIADSRCTDAPARVHRAQSQSVIYWPVGVARVTAVVISSPHLGVIAVATAGVCVLFRAWWTHYLNSVYAAGPAQILLSMLFLELRRCYVNAVQLHVNTEGTPQTSWSGAA